MSRQPQPFKFSLDHSKDFIGVELFQVGTWTDSKGRKKAWTVADLNGIVSAYQATKDEVHPPLKLGHDDKQKLLDDDNEPAIGWLENIRRVGNKLLGDFMKVPDKVATLIEEGSYRARSIEVSPDFEVAGKQYKWLLTGVALLGGRLPAVSGLNDIVALYKREGIEYEENAELVYFESGDEDDELETVLEDLLSQLNSRIKGKKGAPHVRALETALKNAIATTKGRGNHQVDKDKMIKLLGLKADATEEEIEAAVKKLQAKPEEKPAEHSSESNTELEELKTKLNKSDEEILKLQQTNAVAEATRLVDDAIKNGKLLPKQREFAKAFALRDGAEFSKFIETQPDNLVEFGERGSSDTTQINFGKYEPTADEISVAKSLGTWTPEYRISLMRTKAANDGVEIPVNYGKQVVVDDKKEEKKD